jgi:hypothetical protein
MFQRKSSAVNAAPSMMLFKVPLAYSRAWRRLPGGRLDDAIFGGFLFGSSTQSHVNAKCE